MNIFWHYLLQFPFCTKQIGNEVIPIWDYVSELLELFVKTVSICIVIHSQCTMYTLFFNGLMMPITSTASSLNELSFFPFANYMQQLKVTIRETLL